MSFLKQAKMAKQVLAGMSPSEMKELLKTARENKDLINQEIRSIVREELAKLNLPTREEFEELKKSVSK